MAVLCGIKSSIPFAMKAIVAHAYGGPEVLHYESVAKPVPEEGQILVRVKSASATTADTMMLSGKPYLSRLMLGLFRPKNPIPGTGFAGIVEAVGNEVRQFEVGDAVFGETTIGFSANAEYVVVDAEGVVLPKPEHMSYEHAATFCDGPMTSYNFLRKLIYLQADQHILINGASGSLGTAAVQLAKYFGARVAAVCSHRNIGLVQSLGADQVIDYTHKDFTQMDQQYDYIYDAVGKSSFSRSRRVLKTDGQYLTPVLSAKALFQMMFNRFRKQKVRFTATGLQKKEILLEILNELIEISREGHLNIIVDRQYPLAKAAEAYTYIKGGHKKGNIVLQMP